MAGVADSAVGAILEIPDDLLNQIKKAEDYIKDLGKTSERVAHEVSTHWGTIAPSGLQTFIEKIAQAKEAMQNLGSGKVELQINTQSFEQSMANAANAAKKTTNDVSETVQTLAIQSLDFTNINRLRESLDGLDATYNQVIATIKKLEAGRATMVTESTEAQATTNMIQLLKEYIELKKKSEEQQKAKTTVFDQNILNEQKTLLTQILQLQKDINSEELKQSRSQKLGHAIPQEDIDKLDAYKNKVTELTESYEKLRLKLGEMSTAGQKKFNAEDVKAELAMTREQTKAQEQLNQAMQMTSKYSSETKLKSAGISSREEGIYMNELVAAYQQMIKLIKMKGDMEAQIAAAGKGAKAEQVDYLKTLETEYNRLESTLSKISGKYTEIDRAAKSNFENAKTIQEAENAAKLADALQKAADAAEKKRKAQAKTEQTDLSKDKAEYKRVLTLIEQIEKAQRKVNEALASATLPTNLAQQLQSSQTAAEATLTNLYNRRAELEAKRGQELVDIQQQNEVKKGQNAIAEHERAEKEKTRITRQEATDRYNEEMRQARLQNQALTAQGKQQRITITDAREQRAIELTEQRMKEVERLRQEIARLDKQDVNYQKDLDRLNQRINELLGTTQRRVSYTKEEAMAMAKSATTLRELENAYKALKDAMATTDPKSDKWKEMNAQLQKTKTTIDEIKKKMGEFQKQSVNVAGVVGQLRNQIAAAFSVSAINGFIKKMVETRAQFELQRVALGAILQDSQKANQVFVEVQQMALQSPFSIMQLERATKQIAAFGFEADKLKPTLKMLADMSAGLGVEIDRLVLVMGHLKARGFLEGTMVRQFTNAGFNILGGLADYYSELEGKMVSVGEVQDRVKKKMIAFGDVEEVLKRVTSAGGMFYDMQKKQADSIWGQMQRITDAYDLMLNEIGQSNQTSISAALTSIRFLISNWKTVVNILEGATAAMAAYSIKSIYAAYATNALATSQSRLVKAAIAAKAAITKMFTFLAANPYVLLVAGAVAAGAALLDLRKKVDAAHESYANIILGLSERQKKLNDIVDKINASNDKIKATTAAMDKAAKGTYEYNSAVSDNKDALAEQYRVLQELRTTFPEVYNNIVKTKDGTVELTEALEKFNRVSKMVSIITTMTDEDTHWYDEDFKTDMADLSQAQEKYNAQLAKAEAYFNSYTSKAEALYNTRKAEGTLSEEDEAKFRRILALRDSELTIEQKIQEAIKNGYRFKDNWISDLKDNIVQLDNVFKPIQSMGKKGFLFKDLNKNIAEAEREVNEMVQRVLVAAGVTNIEEFQKLPEETRKAAEQASQYMIRESGIALDEIQKDILHRNWEIPLQMRIIPESAEPELNYLQKKINEYIAEHPEVNMPEIKAEEGTDNYFKKLKNNRKEDIEDQKQYNAATAQLDEDRTNAEAVIALKEQENARKAMMDYFGIIEDSKKTGARGEDKELKWWQDLKKAIDDVKTSYDNYRKRYSVEESNRRIEKEYAPLFKELGADIHDFYKNGKYDAAELINALGVLKGMVKETTEARKKFAHDISREQTKTQVEIDLKVREISIKDFQKEIDKMFDNYALTKELSKLGVGVDLTYMVGGKPTTLADIRREYERLMVDFANKSEEEQKIITKMGEDLQKRELDNRKQQLNNYNKFLLESMSERVQIEMKAQREINRIRTDETLDETTRLMAIRRENEKMKKDLASQQWKEFQGSDLYIQLFENIEQASTKSVEYVLEKLKSLRASLTNLPPDQLRAVMKQIDKLEEQVNTRNPFKALSENIGTAIKAFRELGKAEADFQNANERYNNTKFIRDEYAKFTTELEQQLQIERAKLGVNEDGEQVESHITFELEQQLRQRRANLDAINEEVDTLEKEKNKLAEVVADLKKGKEATGQALQKIGSWISEMSSAMGEIATSLENVFGTMNDGMRDAVESTQSVLGGATDMLTGVGRFMAGDYIGGSLQALKGLASTVGSIFAIGDKKKERQIKNLTEKVEILDKAYQKLEKSIESAYTFDDYNAGYKQMKDTLAAEKTAYEEVIRLEEAKKKTDNEKIKEYKDKLEEIAEAEDELRKSQIERFGSTDDVWSEANNWVDAWLDAYKEVGTGIDSLNESWDEFYENLVKKQATSAIVSNRMQDFIKRINDVIDKNMDEYDYVDAFREIGEEFKEKFGTMNEQLIEFFKYAGITGGNGELILSDLQKGIQNITEPQAAAIEAYLNSMRFAVFRHTEQLDTLIATVQSQYGNGAENPVVTELKGIRGVLDNIYSTLRSVVKTQTGKTGIVIVG